MFRSLLRNPFFINPFAIWLRGLIYFFIVKMKYPTVVLQSCVIAKACEFGRFATICNNVSLVRCCIGDYTYISDDALFVNTTIGKFCSIGPGVRCGMGNHPSSTFVSTHPIFYSTLRQAQITFADKSYFEEFSLVEIGNDVWIGANAIIMGGVRVGDGAIIAAGAIVTKDVPPYAIVGGMPAKTLRYRFDEKEINYLLDLRWWDRDIRWIRSNWRDWHDIKQFIGRHG